VTSHDHSARALVVINPHARRGSAAHRYASIRAEVEAGFVVEHAMMDDAGRWIDAIHFARREGFERVIAVGGDGTVHAVANALLDKSLDGLPSASTSMNTSLGAVGLGSSNDFHKPIGRRAHGVPLRLGEPAPRDAGLATWKDARGELHARWFVVSASVGLVARANRRFSEQAGVIGTVARRSVDAGILVAAMSALARHRNVRARVRPSQDGRVAGEHIELSNFSAMLTPYLAGAFRYEPARGAGEGQLAFHLCRDMSRTDLLATMVRLLGGRFDASPKTRSCTAPAMCIELDEEDDLELDGELFRAKSIRLEARPSVLEVCS